VVVATSGDPIAPPVAKQRAVRVVVATQFHVGNEVFHQPRWS